METYQLHVRVEGAWAWVCTIDADTHADAFRFALLCLNREGGSDRPIRFETDTDGAFRKPCPHACDCGTGGQRN